MGGVDKCVHDYTSFKGTRRIIGGTDYIDRVRLCDLPDPRASVYLAVDPYRRPMAVLRYWCAASLFAMAVMIGPLRGSKRCCGRIHSTWWSHSKQLASK